MDIVLLCAGTSSRMQGQDKLLLDAGGMSICSRSALAAIDYIKSVNDGSKLIIVTGYRSQEVLQSISQAIEYAKENSVQVLTVFNENFINGQVSSTKKGLSLVEDKAFFISLGDMPFLKKEHYTTIASELTTYDAVRPFNNSKPGHPVLFANKVKEKILSLNDSQGIITIMPSLKTKNLTIKDEACFKDCDTPQDYKDLLSNLGNCNNPFKL